MSRDDHYDLYGHWRSVRSTARETDGGNDMQRNGDDNSREPKRTLAQQGLDRYLRRAISVLAQLDTALDEIPILHSLHGEIRAALRDVRDAQVYADAVAEENKP